MAELLEASKEDILAILGLGDPTRGDIITVDSTPDYIKLAIGPADNLLISDGTDIAYGKIANANLNAGVFANITGVGVQSQALDMGTTNKIVNLADPTLDQDAATKKFVDDHTWDETELLVAVGASGTILTSNGVGVAPTYQTVSVSQTPWTSDIDANGFDLNDLSNIEFRARTAAPAASVPYINWDTVSMIFNVPINDVFNFKINDVSQLVISTSNLDLVGNQLTNGVIINTIEFQDNALVIQNPADTFNYIFQSSAIIANRTITIPLLTGNDTLVTEAFAQTLTNKTIDGDLNTIIDINETQMNVSVGVSGTVLTSNGVGVAPTYQTGSSPPFIDTNSIVEGSADATKELRFEVDGNTTGIIGVLATAFTTAKTVTFPDATDTLVGKATTDVFTNKSLDANGTGNVITNIGDAEIEAHTSTKITITAKGQLNSAIVYTDQANTFGAFDTSFQDLRLQINNPANTFQYVFDTNAIVADRNVILPLLTGNDTFVFEAFTQTLTNKTYDADGTGNVLTNVGSSEIKSEIITGQTTVTAASGDFVLISDTGDAGNLKKVDANDFLGGASLPVVDTTSIAEGSADATKEVRFEVDGNTTGIIGVLATIFTTAKTVTFPDATDTLVGKATTDVFTNKSLDANGTGNVITNIGDAEIEAHTSTKITITAKGQLNSNIVYTDQANTFGAFDQRFPDNRLQVDNPAQTFQYIFGSAAIIADRTVSLPLLTGNDTFVFEAFGATLTNKTLALGSNTISGTAAEFDTAVTDDNFVYEGQANTWGEFRQTFNPNATIAGINVGAHTAEPSTPIDGDIFYDSTANQLKGRVNAAWVDLGAGSQTPWTSDIDAANFNLTDVERIEFDGAGALGAGTVHYIVSDAGGFTYNVPSGDSHDFRINNVAFVTISTASVNFQGNDIVSLGNITMNSGSTLLVNTDATEAAFLDLGHTADPSSPTGGNMYYNTTANEFRFYNGTVWRSMDATGAGSPPFTDTNSIVEGSADATKELRFEVDGNTTAIIGVIATIFTTAKTVTIPDATDTLMGKATTDVMTNKSLDANGTGNVITNIGDAEIEAHTSTKITITAKGQLNSAIVYTDQTNVFGDFIQD